MKDSFPVPLALGRWLLVSVILKLIPELQLLPRCLVRHNGSPDPSPTSRQQATELSPFWPPRVQEGKKERMREGRRARTPKSLPLEQNLRTAEAVLSGRPQDGSKGRYPGFRRFWEVLTRLVGFKVESIESECGSKDRARLFPRAKVSPGKQ